MGLVEPDDVVREGDWEPASLRSLSIDRFSGDGERLAYRVRVVVEMVVLLLLLLILVASGLARRPCQDL